MRTAGYHGERGEHYRQELNDLQAHVVSSFQIFVRNYCNSIIGRRMLAMRKLMALSAAAYKPTQATGSLLQRAFHQK
jgi:hypothetical protein